jgi:hypothetical protein
MPILGRKPRDCFRIFRDHVGPVMRAVLTEVPVALDEAHDRSTATLAFRHEGQLSSIPIATRFGELHFYFGQLLGASHEKKINKHRLETFKYWYRIHADPEGDAIIRWEYDKSHRVAGKNPCRHHVQLRQRVALGDGELDLNRCHMPTGWVTFEEVLRFLILDLGVAPLCGEEWPKHLAPSEGKFFEDFTSKRYKP